MISGVYHFVTSIRNFFIFLVTSLSLTSVMYGSLCCLSFYVTCSHFRSIWVSMLSEFQCHLVSLPVCMGLYVVRVCMSLSLTSVLYDSLFGHLFYVTQSHFRSVWFSISFRFSMSLSLTFGMYGSLYCPSFYFALILPLFS